MDRYRGRILLVLLLFCFIMALRMLKPMKKIAFDQGRIGILPIRLSLIAQQKAHDAGYSQVLWLDGVERKYIEEVGAMNIFFKIAGKVVTPSLNGSILPGITRDSTIQLCKDWGYEVEERKISAEELLQAQKDGTLEEVFGTGTAAVISPVGKLRYQDEVMTIGGGETGPLSLKLYETITGIQTGKIEDTRGWRVKVGK